MPELPAAERQGNFKEVELGFDEAAGRAEAARCLNCGVCCECGQCVEACLAKAVDHAQHEVRDLSVGAVIVATGSEPFDPSALANVYPYRSCPNVVTSLEFERLLSASGPTMGHLARPSDGTEPKKVAWLQCVGSRDINRSGNGYCSSVCCMFAIKDAMIAKEHANGGLDCTIFYMDIRTFGKEYEKYYLRARDQAGVRFSPPGCTASTRPGRTARSGCATWTTRRTCGRRPSTWWCSRSACRCPETCRR